MEAVCLLNSTMMIDKYFQLRKDLRQYEPLQPMLFNRVMDMLTIMIEPVKNDGQIASVVPYLVDGGLWILQYTMMGFSLWNLTLRKKDI
jgi:hypothetical protein